MSKRFGTPGPRSFNPELCRDQRLAVSSIGAQLLYDRLVLQADDQGRLHGVAHVVKAQCFPLFSAATEKLVKTWLVELIEHELITLYEAADTEVIQIIDWWQNQAGMRRAYPSRWPAAPEWSDRTYGVPDDDRPGTRVGGAPNADSAGKVQRSASRVQPTAANRPENSAPANAHADAHASSAPAEPSRPASAEAQPSTHQQFVAFWCSEFERSKGSSYAFQNGKDGAHAKAILEFAGGDLDLAKARALVLLNSADPFYLKGVDLGTLRSQWNRLGSAGHKSESTGTQPRGAAYQTFVPPDPEADS